MGPQKGCPSDPGGVRGGLDPALYLRDVSTLTQVFINLLIEIEYLTLSVGLHLTYTHRRKFEKQLNPVQGQQFFGSVTKALSRNYTKRQVFRLCLCCEILRFI